MARMVSWLERRFVRAANAESKLYSATTAFMIPAGQPVWSARDVVKFADEGYRRNVIAHRCISMITSAAASVPWKLTEQRARTSRVLAFARCVTHSRQNHSCASTPPVAWVVKW